MPPPPNGRKMAPKNRILLTFCQQNNASFPREIWTLNVNRYHHENFRKRISKCFRKWVIFPNNLILGVLGVHLWRACCSFGLISETSRHVATFPLSLHRRLITDIFHIWQLGRCDRLITPTVTSGDLDLVLWYRHTFERQFSKLRSRSFFSFWTLPVCALQP